MTARFFLNANPLSANTGIIKALNHALRGTVQLMCFFIPAISFYILTSLNSDTAREILTLGYVFTAVTAVAAVLTAGKVMLPGKRMIPWFFMVIWVMFVLLCWVFKCQNSLLD